MARSSRFPQVFLQNKVWVKPQLGWNLWGPEEQRRCLVDEVVSQRFTKAGPVYRQSTQIFAPRESGTWPTGSKVRLEDGRCGYVSAAVIKQGGVLPVPEHWHAYVDIGAVAAPTNGETVVLLRKTLVATDSLGNNRYETLEIPVGGVAVSKLDSAEDGSQLIVTGYLVMPPGTEVTQVDRVRVRGVPYDVTGVGEVLDDPLLVGIGGVQVNIRRTTG